MQQRMTPRRDAILRALVEEYIRTAEPVPSQALAEKYNLGYSSATIRIDMKTLEEDGLIFQRHSSGGRIPTDVGYRYFVEKLMPESSLLPAERRLIRHQFYQVQHQLDQWVRLSASILSQALGGAAVVTLPRATGGRLRHFELLSLHEAVVLLVVVLHDGSALQSRLYLDEVVGQDELSRLAQSYNRRCAGMTADDLAQITSDGVMTAFSSTERTVLLALERHLRESVMWNPEDVYQEGLTRILTQPEFTRLGDEQERSERIRKIVNALEHNRLLTLIGSQPPDEGGVQVLIGSESAQSDLQDVSVVMARYGLQGQAGGILGIVGPTRMQYSRAIALVRYMAQVIDDLLADLYGPEVRVPGQEDSTP